MVAENLKYYNGSVPCCGIFCGGCSHYTRAKSICAGVDSKCAKRQCGFYKCCVIKKGLNYCAECEIFPCSRFKKFNETWLKLGQNLIENQRLIKKLGEKEFLTYCNKMTNNTDNQFSYVTKLDVLFKHLERIDIPQMVAACTDKWFNQTLTQVNGSVVRLGIVEGEYHWHKHDNDDEFFFVIEGQLLIDLEDHTIELNPYQGVTITKGVMHRPRAPKKTVMLMVETCAIQPTGD